MTGGQPAWHAYRCPVCGHRDEVKLAELAGARLDCPHCETTLHVEVSHASSLDARARVVDPPRRSRPGRPGGANTP